MDSLKIKELQLQNNILQQNIKRLYSICSALYQEIQEVKKQTGFKKELNGISTQQNTNAVNVLKEIEAFTEKLPSQSGKKKIINN